MLASLVPSVTERRRLQRLLNGVLMQIEEVVDADNTLKITPREFGRGEPDAKLMVFRKRTKTLETKIEKLCLSFCIALA